MIDNKPKPHPLITYVVTVVDADTLTPLSGIPVSVFDSTQHVWIPTNSTDANGKTGVPSGYPNWRINYSGDTGYNAAYVTIHPPPLSGDATIPLNKTN